MGELTMFPRSQFGAALAEYLCGLLAFVAALAFVPVPTALGGDGELSAAQMLVESIKANYRGYAWGMAVPI